MNKNLNQILLIWIFIVVIQFGISGCAKHEGAKSRHTNFIVILTDDQGASTLEHMPILNRELIAKGINFTQGFVTTPLCCPSRASIFSGQFAHNHGVLDNRLPLGGATRFNDSSTVALWLQRAGYRTALMGKYLNEYNNLSPDGYIPPGWDEWFAFFDGSLPHRFYQNYDVSDSGVIKHYGTKDDEYSTDVLAKRAVEFIKSSKNQPFFLFFSPYSPHPPYEAAVRHRQLYRDDQEIMDQLKLNFNEEDIGDKPEWLRSQEPVNVEAAVSVYQRTLRSLQAVDEAIEDLIIALNQTRQRNNTVIIFLSDNGLTYGEHRLTGQKNCQFEECIRCPVCCILS